MSEVKTTKVTYEQFTSIDFEAPASWYVRIATGDYYFYHIRDRAKAQQAVDDEWGVGKYRVIPTKPNKAPKGEVTATGTSTRKGQK